MMIGKNLMVKGSNYPYTLKVKDQVQVSLN